jgi:hypothetical protein
MVFESGLNARTMASTLSPGLGRKPKKVLETPTDSTELVASLGTLSTFYTENNLHHHL